METKKKTKIIGTISDRKCDPEFVESLMSKGMNAVRLNTAHQNPEDTKRVVDNVRKVSEKIPFVLDTKGPEVRTSGIEIPIEIEKGESVEITNSMDDKEDNKKCFSVNYEGFYNDLEEGDDVLIDDGDIKLKVEEKTENSLKCIAENSGKIKDKKSINVPGRRVNLPSLSEKDKKYVEFCKENDIDFIAHSFVRNKEDVFAIKEALGERADDIKIMAKIEDQEGIDNLDEILDNVYGVMIARGDLGVELPAQKIPEMQRYIVEKCIERKKVVTVATQMLHTMIDNPRPTRAEVSDVANAVYLGADSIMLSGETAYGNYPEESVETMSNIAMEIEEHKEPIDETSIKTINNEIAAFLAKSAVRSTLNLDIKAIVVDTLKGRTPRYVSAFRGKKPVFAQCYDKKVMRQLALSYGIFPSYKEAKSSPDEFISDIVIPLVKNRHFKDEDMITILAGSFGPSNGASFIEISKVKNLVNSGQKDQNSDDKSGKETREDTYSKQTKNL